MMMRRRRGRRRVVMKMVMMRRSRRITMMMIPVGNPSWPATPIATALVSSQNRGVSENELYDDGQWFQKQWVWFHQ